MTPRGGKLLLIALVLGILAVTLGAHSWKRDLPVSSVRVEGNVIVASGDILQAAAIPKNARLFSVDLAAVRKRILKNPFIRAASVNRQGPGGISITVTERRPVALLAAGQLLSVDEEGIVLPAVKSDQLFDLPVLTGALPESECVPGKKITRPAVHEALDALASARQMDEELFRRISEIAVSENGVLVMVTAEGGVPIILGRGEMPRKLLMFDGFWRQVVERRGPKYLQQADVRFADQVIARWNDGPTRQ